ncbi:hypothetical protein K505DRAFT_361563 [Melanomma pulvis-pyrius CBS 109.77]|uniref:BHLH domain-containing protein n=1 Tax=Melanomma pulvis-pyrius CBS 109.77 TaxID=1314802 RepID=A0A6A6XBT1_9PLEO|nr:hypothetical protein K505DRAFT_361563 [Melanomma pulvis-pyrius CBS 109.77]
MDSRDPPPFGYTFTGDFYGAESTAFSNGGPSLLSDMENQSLQDFFSNTEFLSDAPQFSAHPDTKDGLDHLNWAYVPPATIHRVSTTIPDQAQLHHGFNFDQSFAPESLSAGHLGNTQDDLQAASTLFTNAQASYANGRSHSFHGVPSASTDPSNLSAVGLHNMPMVSTPHGLLNEQLAALLPNHAEDGSIDAQIAAQFAANQARHAREAHAAELERQRPQLKRSYTYGTDNAFNSSGFVASSPNAADEAATSRLFIDLHRPQSFKHQPTSDDDDDGSDAKPVRIPPGLIHIPSDDERQSDGATSGEEDDDDDDDRPTKKRRKARSSTSTKCSKPPASARKNSSAARLGKNRKASLDETNGRKKRLSSAGQKAQRENLSDEQKRSNHILSEQKRRNLIKRGFDDLHDLVPAIRNGGLSKSSVLTEAANFLDKLTEENNHFIKLSAAADG